MDVANKIKQWFAEKFKEVKGITMSLYWQSMRLEYDPFMAEQANQTPFVFPKWEQQLNLLVHLATRQDSMLLVLGVSGIGKSTMMRQFIDNLGHSGGICKIHGGATITAEVLQDLIARHLGFALSQQDPEQFSSQLLERMGRMRAEGHDFYLVIDNAHKLPKASLALLLQLVEIQGGDHHPIHIVLFGGPQLEATIGEITSQHLGEVLTHSIHMEPLTVDYLKNYVEQRLQLAGFSDALPFTQNQLQQIYQISGGIPAKVNSLARQLLLQWTQQGGKKSGSKKSQLAIGANQHQRKPLSVYWFGGAAVAVIAVIFLVMFYFNTTHEGVINNQTLMVSSAKANAQQDYDEAGSESSVNHAVSQANSQRVAATMNASSIPDSSYTEVDSDGDSSVGSDTTSTGSNNANAASSQAQNNAASSGSVGSAEGANAGSEGTAGSADTSTTSEGMINSDDDVSSSNVGSEAQQTQSSLNSAHQTVNQALADNAALGKQSAAASSNATAIGLSTQASAAPNAAPSKSSDASLVKTGAATPAPTQNADDAEYIPSGNQIPVAHTTAPMPQVASTAVPAMAVKATNPAAKVASPSPANAIQADAKPAAATKPMHATQANAKPVVASKTRAGLDATYFQSQPASRVGLQLAGARDVTKLKQEVASYALPGKVHYFKTMMNGAPWYVAIYGNYPSIALAANAKTSLPAPVLAAKPWPRSFQNIQSAINIG